MKPYQQVCGRGPDVLLLHGWGLNGDVWSPLLSAPGTFRLRAMDLPGYARSNECECPQTLDALSDVVAAALPGPAVWVGWSLGGLLALHAARRWPDRITGLVLVASTPRFVRAPDWPHALEPALLADFARALERDERATLLRFLTLQTRVDGRADRALVVWLRARLERHGVPRRSVLRAGLDLLRTSDLRADAARVSCPRLLILGAGDPLIPVELGDDLRQLGAWRTAVVPGSAHIPFVSHAPAFRQMLYGFLHDLR